MASAGVALCVAAFALPRALNPWALSPDAAEHLAIANSWVHGAGFVDPVQWSYNFDAGIPRPAFAVRGAVLPMLLAIPLWLGATIGTVLQVHAVWAVAVTAAIMNVARPMLSLPAAAAAVLLIGLAPAWLLVANNAWTEVTGVAALLLIVATARGVTRSAWGALGCGAATLLGWAVRPNLGAMALAVLVVAFWQLGPREALRRSGPWTYLLFVAAGYALIHLMMTRATGYAPYAGYAGAFEVLAEGESMDFRKEYVGTWLFLQEHWAEVLDNVRQRAVDLTQALFRGHAHHRAGWLAVTGIPYVLLRGGRGAFERRLCALAALGYALVVLAVHGTFDPVRYPLFVAIPSVLCGLAFLDDLTRRGVRWAAERTGRVAPRWGSALPLILVVVMIAGTTGRPSASFAWESLRAYQRSDHVGPMSPGGGGVSDLCREIPREALVTGPLPWEYTIWCGNPALLVANDLATPKWRRRFLLQHGPQYLIDGPPLFLIRGAPWARSSPLLERLDRSGVHTLYRVRGANQETGSWTPPPPLACAGHGPQCRLGLGR